MEEASVLSRLQRLCSRAEYCRSDIYRKALNALDQDREAASRVLDALVRDRFVDDRRYASAFAREKAALQGWGSAKIRFMLLGKGVEPEAIAAALSDIDTETASSRLDKLVSAKFRVLKGDPQWRPKLVKYALGRGYSFEETEAAIARSISD